MRIQNQPSNVSGHDRSAMHRDDMADFRKYKIASGQIKPFDIT